MTKLLISLGILAVSCVIWMLTAYIAFDIIALYKISFLSQLTYLQIYGSVLVIKLLLPISKPVTEDMTFSEQLSMCGEYFGRRIFFDLLSWSLAYVTHFILTA